jgi:large subunit ribosomal protein L27
LNCSFAFYILNFKFREFIMAHTKAVGSTQLGRDSQPKYLGVKLYDGQPTQPGSIIIRQRGSKFFPGKGVRIGRDDTIYAVTKGHIKFTTIKRKRFDGSRRLVKVVNVITK